MRIYQPEGDKKQYLDLLLLADEDEAMIDRYLPQGRLYALDEGGVQAVCVVAEAEAGVLELKNIAVRPQFQRRGYGRALVDFIVNEYRGRYERLQVGTGEVPWIIRFYEKCGFARSGVVKNFFTDNYDHPMFDSGGQLVDMIYLSRSL